MSDLTLLIGALDAMWAENLHDAADHIKRYLREEGLIETPDAWIMPEGSPTSPGPSGPLGPIRPPIQTLDELIKEDAKLEHPIIQASDEEFDSLVASALGSIQWVIDDLRSWESNPESANYNADKLADAVTVIRARMSGKDVS